MHAFLIQSVAPASRKCGRALSVPHSVSQSACVIILIYLSKARAHLSGALKNVSLVTNHLASVFEKKSCCIHSSLKLFSLLRMIWTNKLVFAHHKPLVKSSIYVLDRVLREWRAPRSAPVSGACSRRLYSYYTLIQIFTKDKPTCLFSPHRY